MDYALMIESILPIMAGARVTLQLVVISLTMGFGLAVVSAVVRRADIPLASRLVRIYVFAIRGTPLLVQIFLIYYGLGQFAWIRESVLWPVLQKPFWCAIIALTINTTAYGSEIIRGGLDAVPWEEVEAARSIGMSGLLLFRRVIFPVAIRQALPAYGNEVILMVKATSLASTITIMEMTGVANVIMAENYRPLEAFLIAGGFYLLINFVLTRCIQIIEWFLSGHLRSPKAVPATR